MMVVQSWVLFYFLFSSNFIWSSSKEPKKLERLLSGHDEIAQPHQFPWLVLMSLSDFASIVTSCAGSILSDRWILTSSYCIRDAEVASIYTSIMDSKMEFTNPKRAKYFVTHEDTSGKNGEADLGLIKLLEKLTFSETVQPIKLPDYELEDFAVVTVPGWEWNEKTQNWASEYLHYLHLSVITSEECGVFFDYDIFDGTFCTTTGPNRNPCESNSGDGAIAYYDNEPRLVGVHSFVASHCRPDTPMGFVRVFKYNRWIKEITGL